MQRQVHSHQGSKAEKWYITNKKNGTTPTPPTPDQDLGKPEHKKTILKQGEYDYRLSLDVKGEVGQATPIEVLLIVDEQAVWRVTEKEM